MSKLIEVTDATFEAEILKSPSPGRRGLLWRPVWAVPCIETNP